MAIFFIYLLSMVLDELGETISEFLSLLHCRLFQWLLSLLQSKKLAMPLESNSYIFLKKLLGNESNGHKRVSSDAIKPIWFHELPSGCFETHRGKPSERLPTSLMLT